MTELVSNEVTERQGGKFLTLFLGEEEYGLEILKVQEIISIMEITPIPHTPPFSFAGWSTCAAR